jgi:hypothetical protein
VKPTVGFTLPWAAVTSFGSAQDRLCTQYLRCGLRPCSEVKGEPRPRKVPWILGEFESIPAIACGRRAELILILIIERVPAHVHLYLSRYH